MSDKIEKFEDLNIWKEGIILVTDIYKVLGNCKDFGLKDQMQRAAVSIPSNIAEGFERNTNKEFIHYLFIAKGSTAELRTQLYIALNLKIIESSIGNELIDRTRKISAMIFKLIKTRKANF
jgi:four helix bundle protein